MKNFWKKVFYLFLILFAFFIVNGCSKKEEKKSIVGSWKRDGYIYTFYNSHTGYYEVSGTKLNFTYKDEGKTISILYNGNVNSSDFEYKFEGNKLIIKNHNGKNMEYIKQ